MLNSFTLAAMLTATMSLTACGGGEDMGAEDQQETRHVSISDLASQTMAGEAPVQ